MNHQSIAEFVDSVRNDVHGSVSADPRVSKASKVHRIATSTNNFIIVGVEVGNSYREFDLDPFMTIDEFKAIINHWVDEKMKETELLNPAIERRLAIKKLLNGAIEVTDLIPIKGGRIFNFDAGIDMADPAVTFGVRINRLPDEEIDSPKCAGNSMVLQALGNSEVEAIVREVKMCIPEKDWGICYMDVNSGEIKFIERVGMLSDGSIALVCNTERIRLSDDMNAHVVSHIRNSKTVQDLVKGMQ